VNGLPSSIRVGDGDNPVFLFGDEVS